MTIHDNPAQSRFEYPSPGEPAVVTYTLSGDVITFDHTLVPDALRGQGIATKLVLACLESARARGLRVVPQCTVFSAYMRKHPETHDLLADEARALLDRA